MRSFSSRPLSPFGNYLVALCEARNIKVFSLVDVVGSKTRLSFALRGRTTTGRGALLTFEQLAELAHRLRTNTSETRRLILLGLLEHAPKELRSCVIGMTEQVVAMAERLNAPVPNFDFSGKARDLPKEL